MLFIKEIEDAIVKKEINGDVWRAYRQSKEYGNSKINFYRFSLNDDLPQIIGALKAANVTEFTITDDGSGWIETLAFLQKSGFVVAGTVEVYSPRRIYKDSEVVGYELDPAVLMKAI